MTPLLYLRHIDLFDVEPTKDDLVNLLAEIPIRHAVHALLSMNLWLRIAGLDDKEEKETGMLQEKLMASYLDDECLNALKARFPRARCEDRPVFFPESVLNVLRVVLEHGDSAPFPVIEQDEEIRYLLGRAFLMVNNLLLNEDQIGSLQVGSDEDKRIELMTQARPSFEVQNPPKASHLIPRLEVMFRILLRNPEVKARIIKRTGGFDLEKEFGDKVGISLDHWLFVVFTFYAYFINTGSALNPDATYMVISPSIFRGDSGISEEELMAVLSIVSAPFEVLKTRMASVQHTDSRYDFVEYRSTPLLELEKDKLLPVDLAFVLDKCHTGVHWALHDKLNLKKERHSLFTSWGELFQEYVHWLLGGMNTKLAITYLPSPEWKESGDESFDGILLKDAVMMPAEFKGGFMAREARYSCDSSVFLADLDKKFTEGCKQLADKIGIAFCEDELRRGEIEGANLSQIRAVVPILVLQDHILRVPFMNWYLNRKFQEYLSEKTIRAGVVIRPLTLLMIDYLESIIHSVESEDFDLVYELHHRSVRDPQMLSPLPEWLSKCENYGRKPSPRLVGVFDQAMADIKAFIFPGAKAS